MAVLVGIALCAVLYYVNESERRSTEEREFFRFKAYDRTNRIFFSSADELRSRLKSGWKPDNWIVQLPKDFSLSEWPSNVPLTSVSLSGRTLEAGDLQSLSPLTDLERLDLSDCKIPVEVTRTLPDLKHLQTLWLVNSRLSRKSFEQFARKYGSTLRVLSLENSSIDDSHAECLPYFTELRALQLQYTALTDESVRPILAMPKLRVVTLSENGELALYGLHDFEQQKPSLLVDRLTNR